MNVTATSPIKTCPRRKFTDEKLIEHHSHGLSISKLAKQLGVSQRAVCSRMKKLGLRPNYKPGGVAKYEKVGTDKFRCASCGRDKPLRQRDGTKCNRCTYQRSVSTREGALRRRFIMKRCHARIKGIQFTLTFEEYNGLYDKQAGKDGYTGQQMVFDFGQGRTAATMSLDRIENANGYAPGNVVFCRLETNGKKGKKPKDEFMKQLSLEFPEANDPSLEAPGRPSI